MKSVLKGKSWGKEGELTCSRFLKKRHSGKGGKIPWSCFSLKKFWAEEGKPSVHFNYVKVGGIPHATKTSLGYEPIKSLIKSSNNDITLIPKWPQGLPLQLLLTKFNSAKCANNFDLRGDSCVTNLELLSWLNLTIVPVSGRLLGAVHKWCHLVGRGDSQKVPRSDGWARRAKKWPTVVKYWRA